MASVGGVSCDFVHLRASALKTVTQIWREPGQVGYGVHSMGKGAAPFRCRARKVDSLANVLTWMASIEALGGSNVTIIDDTGESYSNLHIDSDTMDAPDRPAFVQPGTSNDTLGIINFAGVKTN